MILRWMAALAVVALAVMSGCGGGTDRTKAQVRLVNASTGYAQLELRVDDQLRQGGVAYGGSAGYAEAEPGKIFTVGSPNSPTSLLSFTPGVAANKYYTVLAYGRAGALKQLLLDDNNAQPDTNRTFFRVINAAPDAGTLDVYITASGDALETAVPVQRAAAVDAVGSFLTINSGTWRLRVTAPDGKTAADVRLDLPAVTLASRQVVTLVLVPGQGGVLVKALLLAQQAGIDERASTQARVRVATGLVSVGVTQTGNSTALLTPTALPTINNYAVVSAGAITLNVTVDGVARPAYAATLAAGADYTLLVHGTAASSEVVLIEDNNLLPTDVTKAKVRLLNGVSGVAGALSMSIDDLALPESALAGAATGYVLQNATATARIAVAGAGAGTLYSGVDQVFAAGANYTVFVIGPAAGPPTGVLRKDR